MRAQSQHILVKIDRPEIALIEPALRLLRENAWKAFAFEVHPFTAVAREPRWQILKTAGIDLAKLRIEVRRRIAERHGRKTALPITALGRGFGLRPKRAMT